MKGRREMPSGVAQVMSRVVLITGCSTGIGRAVMERLTVSRHAVVATAGRAESLKGVAASSGLGAGCHRLGRHGILPSPRSRGDTGVSTCCSTMPGGPSAESSRRSRALR